MSVSVEEVLVVLKPVQRWETLEGSLIVLSFLLLKHCLVLLI